MMSCVLPYFAKDINHPSRAVIWRPGLWSQDLECYPLAGKASAQKFSCPYLFWSHAWSNTSMVLLNQAGWRSVGPSCIHPEQENKYLWHITEHPVARSKKHWCFSVWSSIHGKHTKPLTPPTSFLGPFSPLLFLCSPGNHFPLHLKLKLVLRCARYHFLWLILPFICQHALEPG